MLEINTIGLIGAGVISSGWAVRCLASGLDIIATATRAASRDKLMASIENAWPAMQDLGLVEDLEYHRVRFTTDLDEVCTQADFIQESVLEREELKQSLYVQMDAVARPEVIIASSSSGLLPSRLQAACRHPEHVVIGHPFSPVLANYLQKGMKFFVAKVNLKVHRDRGATYLRPLQVAFESESFMLPIRLGMINASGPQELFIFTLTRTGRVETINYPVKRIPSNKQIPLYVKNEFGDFYRAMFNQQVRTDQMRSVFLEYAWDMGWCDPCAADPLSVEELRELGVFWQRPVATTGLKRQARDVFVTRLHLRYTADTFPHDLMFRETTDRENFQGRYILRHPWKGRLVHCQAAQKYLATLPQRFENEARELAQLTGADVAVIRQKMAANGQSFDLPADVDDPKWYQKLWRK